MLHCGCVWKTTRANTARTCCTAGWRPLIRRPRRALHPHDVRRVIRALEVIELTGRPMSVLQAEHDRLAPAAVPIVALDLPRAALHERINRRVVQFFDAGLVEEVRALQAGPRPLGDVAAQAIGYREVIAMLAGKASLGSTIEQVQTRTRQFAKRQATWFRGLEEVRSCPVAPDDDPEAIAERLVPIIDAVRSHTCSTTAAN